MTLKSQVSSRFLILALLQALLTANPLTAALPSQDAQCVKLTRSDLQTVSLEFSLQNIQPQRVSEPTGEYTLYEIPGEGITYEHGKPVLPAVSRLVVVPPDAGLELVVASDEPRVIPAEHPPLLCDESELLKAKNINYSAERGWGDEPTLYPPLFAEMSEPMVIRGARVVRVTTYPVQYDPASNSYLYRDHIEAQVRFTNSDPVNPVKHPVRRHRSEAFKNFIQGLALNGADVGRDDPDYGEEPTYLGHYLVVSHEDCLEYAAPWIEWRRKQGYKVDIFRVPTNKADEPDWVRDSMAVIYDNYLADGVDPFDEILLIGDHESHDACGPESNWKLATFVGNSNWPYNTNHADWFYACLEGDRDVYADAGIARWCSGSADLMKLFVMRTLSYEVTPYMDDTDWFTRGAVYSQKWGGTWHISLHTNVRWGVEVLQQAGFDDVRFLEGTNDDGGAGIVGPFIVDQFNDGVNVMMGRAENYYFRSGFPVDDDAVVFPIDIDIAGHHEWSTWWMLRSGTANNLKGPVSAVTGWGGPQTLPFSVAWMEAVNGFLCRDLPYGWARLQSVMGPEAYFPNFGSTYNHVKTDVVFYGDPGMHWWRGVPQQVTAEYPESVPEDVKYIEVKVLDPDTDEPVPGAQVTLYAPGDMPDFDEESYAEYNEMRMITHRSDNEGMARFVFNEPFVDDNAIYLTISGRDILPVLDTIAIEQPDLGVEVSGWWLEQIEGNDDEDLNPGERFNLYITAKNVGDDDFQTSVGAVVTSLSGWVTAGDNQLDFGALAAGAEVEAEDSVEIELAAGCPDGASRPSTRPVLMVAFSADNSVWHSAVMLEPKAPNLEVKQVVDGIIIPDTIRAIDIEVENFGSVPSQDLTVKIVPLVTGKIGTIDDESRYAGIGVGRSDSLDGDRFTVAGTSLTIPGTRIPMALVFYDGEEVVDSARFELQVREPSQGMPQGPDAYGYICFDDEDVDWDIAPEYEWVEISTREQDRDYDGTHLDLSANPTEQIGDCKVVAMGMGFQFYGIVYDTISIATNGFIAPGNQPKIVNFQNWPLDRGIGGGAGMLAPFWDDLRLGGDDPGVYYYHDEDNSRFIVEWYKVKLAEGGNYLQTFEVILYDHEIWITETGDQNIVFQYKTITTDRQNVRAGATAWANEVPYASVGISSPRGDTGLSYLFNKTYPVTSDTLRALRALLFATAPKYKAAVLMGRVTDYETGFPIEAAIVRTKHNFTAVTDGNGDWLMSRVLAEVPFDITASKQGYNDSTLYDLEVDENDTMVIDFALLHPEFLPSTNLLAATVDSGRSVELPFDIRNDGNGPLDWTMRRRLPRGADVPPWTLRLSYYFGQQLRDNRIEGVVFADGKFFVAGGDPEDNEQNWIYIFNPDGELLDMFEQPGQSQYGFGDLDWDGELLWGSGEHNVYGITTEGVVVSTFEGPDRIKNQAIAWDPDRECLWICSITANEIIGCNRNGNPLDEVVNPGFRIRGLAYWLEDPDHPLYIIHSPDNTRQIVHKMNPDTGDTVFVAELQPERGGTPGGAYITNQYDVYSWVFASVANDANRDRVDIWQVDARRDWFIASKETADGWLPADAGRIDATQTQQFKLALNTVDLIKDRFEAFLIYWHNAAGGEDTINVELDVIGPREPSEFSLATPANGDSILSNTEVSFNWQPSIDPNFGEQPVYHVWFQMGADSVMREDADTALAVDVGALGLNLANDVQVIWWVHAVSGLDSVASRERFALHYFINDLPVNETQPVEFGISSIHPTPFNSQTAVRFGADRAERVTIHAYDIQGRLVATLYDRTPRVGYHQLVWNASAFPAGLYMIRLESGSRIQTAKVALVK